MMVGTLSHLVDCTVDAENLNQCSRTALKDVRRVDKLEEVFLDGESMSAQLLVKIGEGNVRVKVCWFNKTHGVCGLQACIVGVW